MKSSNRDLLVLSKKVSLDPIELEHEVELLHELLFMLSHFQILVTPLK